MPYLTFKDTKLSEKRKDKSKISYKRAHFLMLFEQMWAKRCKK